MKMSVYLESNKKKEDEENDVTYDDDKGNRKTYGTY